MARIYMKHAIITYVHDAYGASIRHFIPYQWRLWWIDVMRTKFPRVDGSNTIQSPAPTFLDRTCNNNIINKVLIKTSMN
jgi:hypothetical protein